MKIRDIKTRIKNFFFVHPTEKLRVRQIERSVNIPLPSAIRYVKELIGEGILRKITISNTDFYTADRSSKRFLEEKRLFNLKSLPPLIEYIIAEYNNPVIVLLGSYSRGEDTENSDIDLYVEHPSRIKGIEKFEKSLKRDIQIFNYKSINEVRNKEFANNIANGIVMNGFLEVFS